MLGTQQVETKIDQDSYLSSQLTLWDQRGSNVIRGNVLVIPIEDTLLYVEPIYRRAEAAAYPELRLVAVMHNDRLSYAETFDEALRGLFEEKPREDVLSDRTVSVGPGQAKKPGKAREPRGPLEQRIRRARQAFDRYLEAMSDRRFGDAGRALESLGGALEEAIGGAGEEQARTGAAAPTGSGAASDRPTVAAGDAP